ncbi:MAG: DUF4149 domain-containing protein [Myxococcota bacterium]
MSLVPTLLLVTTASLFGGMVFFPSVVAPMVFRVLDTDAAGRFLRALFPRYYTFMIATSGLGAAFAGIAGRWRDAVILLLVALSTLAVRQLLVPAINRWRDAGRAGDDAAARRFERGHRLSVGINMIQLVAVLVVLWPG